MSDRNIFIFSVAGVRIPLLVVGGCYFAHRITQEAAVGLNSSSGCECRSS